MFSQPLNPDNPEDLRKCHAICTRKRNELIDERTALENCIKASAEFKQVKERRAQLGKQLAAYRTKSSKALDAIWDRFLKRRYDHQSKSPYYDKTSSFDNTNIHPHVLSAISTIAPLSKLTPENIRDAVRAMVDKATAEDKSHQALREKAMVLSREDSALMAKEHEMLRSDKMDELNGKICELYRELETIGDMLSNPNKYKRRADVALAREAVGLNIGKIYETCKKLEATARW